MALPLLALGGAAARAGLGAIAKTTGRVAARTGAAITGAAGGAAGAATALGFADLMKKGSEQSPASNVVDFKAANSAVGGNNRSSSGAAAPIATPTVSPTNSMSGDIAAASELSMEELAKQTKILTSIQKNTGQTAKNTIVPPSAGGQATPPPTEEEIKAKLDGEGDGKLRGILSNLTKSVLPLGDAILALGAAVAAIEGDKFFNKEKAKAREEEMSQSTPALAALGGAQVSELFREEGSAAMAGLGFKTGKASKATIAANEGNISRLKNLAEQQLSVQGKSEEEISQAKNQIQSAFESGDMALAYREIQKYNTGEGEPIVYQTKVDPSRFSMGSAERIAKSYGIEGRGKEEGEEEFKQRVLKSTSFEQDYAKSKAEAYMGGTAARTAVSSRLEESLIRGSGAETSFGDYFSAEGREKKRKAGEIEDALEAKLEKVVSTLKESGLSDAEINRKLAAENTKISKMSSDQLASYDIEKSVMSGQKVESAQQQADKARDQKAASRMPAPTASAPSQQQPAPPQDTVTTGISINNKAHDDLAKVLTQRSSGGFFSSFGF